MHRRGKVMKYCRMEVLHEARGWEGEGGASVAVMLFHGISFCCTPKGKIRKLLFHWPFRHVNSFCKHPGIDPESRYITRCCSPAWMYVVSMSMERISSLLHFGKKEGKVLSKDLKLWQEGNKIPHCTTTCQQPGAWSCHRSRLIPDMSVLAFACSPFKGDAHTSHLWLFTFDIFRVSTNFTKWSTCSFFTSCFSLRHWWFCWCWSWMFLHSCWCKTRSGGCCWSSRAPLTHVRKILIWPACAFVLEVSVRKFTQEAKTVCLSSMVILKGVVLPKINPPIKRDEGKQPGRQI